LISKDLDRFIVVALVAWATLGFVVGALIDIIWSFRKLPLTFQIGFAVCTWFLPFYLMTTYIIVTLQRSWRRSIIILLWLLCHVLVLGAALSAGGLFQ